MRTLPSLVLILLMVGCTSIWQGTVTLTATVDSASKEYAKLFNQGLVTPSVDAQVTQAHAVYQAASSAAAAALRAYKLSGDVSQYNQAFAEALRAAQEFINLIVPLLTPDKAVTIKNNLAKVGTL